MKRQNVRKLILIVSLLLFPITIYYMSPYLIIAGAMEGIINGSFIVFMAQFILSIFFGRLFCSYLCPMGGLQECLTSVTDKSPKQGWRNKIKYVIWGLWVIAIILCFINRKDTVHIDMFYMTENGISVSDIYGYIVYYGIILLTVIPAIVHGKRAICHYLCWMAPFMAIGTKLRKVLHLPGLHIEAESDQCVSCKLCNKKCPMSLNVYEMVKSGKSFGSECIQCGECVDSCPKKVLKYSMRKEK